MSISYLEFIGQTGSRLVSLALEVYGNGQSKKTSYGLSLIFALNWLPILV